VVQHRKTPDKWIPAQVQPSKEGQPQPREGRQDLPEWTQWQECSQDRVPAHG